MNSDSMSRPFFSVIAPCCNVSMHLDAMLASVRNQSFVDWECILSVERSTDDTHERCAEAARQDTRFRVLFGERSGSPASPRNRGLDVARGTYVVWLDGDDFLADDGVLARIAAACANGEPDVIQFAAERRDEDAEGRVVSCVRFANFLPTDDGRMWSGYEALVSIARRGASYFPMSWLMALRLDFLRENAIRFVPGLIYEDSESTPRIFYAAKSVSYLDAVCYVYRRRMGSVTTNAFSVRELACLAESVRLLLRFHVTHPFDVGLSQAWARLVLSRFLFKFFNPWYTTRIARRDWTSCARMLLKGTGRTDFLRLVRFAGLPKRFAAPLVLLCGIHPILDCPARAFFRCVYYPLALRDMKASS